MTSFLGLITRCKDEYFIKEFCDYYISQGVDKIYVIDDDSINKSIYSDINNNKVKIIYEKDIINNNCVSKLYKEIRNKFEWLIYCDVDEFITTKKNLNKTIRYELENTFKNYHCVCVPWVMMGCNNRKKNPKSILKENIYRWNHDIKHYKYKKIGYNDPYTAIECKSIFKPKFFKNIKTHIPIQYLGEKNKIVNSIDLKTITGTKYKNFREIHIKIGYLLCYHYRIISEENSLNKIKNNIFYKKYKINDLMSFDYSEIKDET
jgi:hypothetical protein